MNKLMSCMTCGSNVVSLSSRSIREIPVTRRRISVPKALRVTSKDGFMWANSEDGANSTSNYQSLSLTPNFILPVERRPNLEQVYNDGIPVIDMGEGDTCALIERIARASEEYGLFLITNHGIPRELCESMLSAVTNLFHLPPQAKSVLVSDDPTKDVRIANHYRKVEENGIQQRKKFSMWSEVFKHPWHPTDDGFIALLPSEPPEYRTVVAEYSKQMGDLMSQLLNLMSRGLGLDENHLLKVLGRNPLCRAQANYYPPCSKPDLTLGLGVHTDRDALTVVLPSPNVAGLQIMKDDKWIAVDPVPNALVINLGDQLQILSNGRYKSVVHRVVTNEHRSRVSLALFYGPDKDAFIGPVDSLIDEQHPPAYRHYYFREFLEEYRNQEGKNRKIKEAFEI
uniref:Flavonol synthase n=1 Tax=Dianthus caryophyllus TaxID=3570 RepID=A0A097NUZ1_DIACA|nr:flavonol synthase [Dianthus caryophyllus]BBK26423.1 flavonol synthase [Dianthus caryophyllus]